MASAFHSQALPPSGFSHALLLNLSSSASLPSTSLAPSSSRGPLVSQLVTARDDLLSVYNIHRSPASLPSALDQASQESVSIYLVRQHELFGSVTGLERVSTTASEKDGRHRLLVSLKDAKMILMEWCDHTSDLETISIHTYERAPQLADGLPALFSPILTADPASRCAALLLPQDSIAVLPFYQDLSDLEFYDLDPDSAQNSQLNQIEALPYSPSFVLPLHDVDAKIANVRGITFLPGFQKPTLAVLFEQPFTWAGRLTEHRDSTALYIFTLDLTASMAGTDADTGLQPVHPILTTSSALPHDALYMVPCPVALGGVVIVTMSSLVHIDQSGRVVATALNDWFSLTSAIQPESTLKLPGINDLQNSHLTFTDTSEGILSLQDGSVCRFTCLMDGRNVEGFRLQHLVSNPVHHADELPVQVFPPSAVALTPGDRRLVFFASMVGDSTLAELLKVRQDNPADADVKKEEPEQQVKNQAMDLDLDEDLYGESAAPGPNQTGESTSHHREMLVLAERDRIQAYGSIVKVARRTPPAAIDQDQESHATERAQLMASTGAGSGAGVTYFQAGQTPKKKRRLDTRPAFRVWNLDPASNPGQSAPGPSSIVLTAEDERVSETISFDPSGNISGLREIQEEILAAGPLKHSSEAYATVSPRGFSVLARKDGHVVQQVTFGPDAAAVKASIEAGAYALIHLSDGSHRLYNFDHDTGKFEKMAWPDNVYSKQIVSANVFTDVYHSFQRISKNKAASITTSAASHSAATASKAKRQAASKLAVDEGDEIDYGEDNIDRDGDQPMSDGVDQKNTMQSNGVNGDHDSDAVYLGEAIDYVFLLDSEGVSEIYSLPDMTLAWRTHSLPALANRLDLERERYYELRDEHIVAIKEARLCHLGDLAHIVVVTEQDLLLAYEANPQPNSGDDFARPLTAQDEGMLSLGFNKVLARALAARRRSRGRGGQNGHSNSDGQGAVEVRPLRLRSHAEDAVAVLGAGPTTGSCWLIRTQKGGLSLLDCEDGGDLDDVCWVGPAPGDLLVCVQGSVYLSSLEPEANIAGSWTYETFRPGRTYTYLASHDATGCIVAASVNDSQFVLFDDENQPIKDPAADPTPTVSQTGALELFVGDDRLEPVHGFDFEANETVSALEVVTLDSPSTADGRKKFIAVGTTMQHGEDRAAKGCTYLFDVIEVVASPSDPSNRFRLKLLCKDDSKAPVTALADINGFLISTSGQKLFVRALEKDEWLISVAFFDVGFYVTSITVLKNFLLLSDMRKSLWFLGFQEEPYRVVVLGKDNAIQFATTGSYLVNGSRLSLVSTSAEGVIRIFEYAPNTPSSLGGQRLLVRTEYQSAAGEAVKSVLVKGRWLAGREPKGYESLRSKIIYGMNNGSVETVAAADERVVKRLQLLQSQLVRTVQHFGGLNPRGFRMVRNDTVSRPLTKGIVDDRLISLFESLPRPRMLAAVSTVASLYNETDLSAVSDLVLAELVRLRAGFEPM